MLKSSRRAHSISKFSPAKVINDEFESSIYGEEALLRPEDRFVREALEDGYYKTLITLSLGRALSERTSISKTEVERFTLLYETDPNGVREKTYTSVIPIKKRGFSWGSFQSNSLRRKYKSSADKLFDTLSLCDFGDSHFTSGLIELVNIPYKTIDYLEFSSAMALVDKKPHKRKENNSGDAVYYRDFYLDGGRGMLFAVVDAQSGDSKSDYKIADLIISNFKRFFSNNVLSTNEEEIFSLFSTFLNYLEEQLSSSKFKNPGASISIGVVYSKVLYYLNLGDSRIYSLSFYPDVKVKKITVDDGVAGLVERGAKMLQKEFFSQLNFPEYYVGAFSQYNSRKGRRILHKKINPVYPNIGKVSLSDSEFILVGTDGFWTNLPIKTDGKYILDATGESIISSVLSKVNSRGPKQIVESLYSLSKSNMKGKRSVLHNGEIVKPNPQDMAILGFSI